MDTQIITYSRHHGLNLQAVGIEPLQVSPPKQLTCNCYSQHIRLYLFGYQHQGADQCIFQIDQYAINLIKFINKSFSDREFVRDTFDNFKDKWNKLPISEQSQKEILKDLKKILQIQYHQNMFCQ